MAKPIKNSRSGFVIKLSCDTVKKISEEEEQNKKEQDDKHPISSSENKEAEETINIVNEHVDSLEKHNDTFEVKKDSLALESDNKNDSNLSAIDTSTVAKSKSGEATCESPSDIIAEKSVHHNTTSDSVTWGDYAPCISYEGEEPIYTDPSTQQKYVWSRESNSWTPKPGQDVPGRVYSYENDTHVYTEPDGSKFFWDVDKKAWIPKVDDDFLAFYQMSYGFVDNTSKDNVKDDVKKEKEKKDPAAVKRKNEPQWFEPSEETNTKVYVSNLPQDLTEEEFVNLMQKCGLVERDPSSQKMKVKLYMDKEHHCFKGDALCTYIKIESVDLALKLLDGSDYKGNKIRVERAHFQLKGEYNPALKPKKKKKKELEKIKKMQQKLFDWRPEKFVGERSKHERVVIVKNLFHPTDFDKEVQLILDYQQDLREECSKCGEVRKVVIYDRHPEGVAQITMKEPEEADAVVLLINGRWFGKRQITAEIWDGRTKYRIAETDADISKRIDKWDKFLEGKDDNKDKGVDSKDSKDIDKTTDSVVVQSQAESVSDDAKDSKDIDKTTDSVVVQSQAESVSDDPKDSKDIDKTADSVVVQSQAESISS